MRWIELPKCVFGQKFGKHHLYVHYLSHVQLETNKLQGCEWYVETLLNLSKTLGSSGSSFGGTSPTGAAGLEQQRNGCSDGSLPNVSGS